MFIGSGFYPRSIKASGLHQAACCSINRLRRPSVRSDEAALEHTTAEVKAQKVVENGQLIILRGNVRYNATGAKL